MSALAVEMCIVQSLQELLVTDEILHMNDEKLRYIAGEHESDMKDREATQKKLKILQEVASDSYV